MLPRVLEPEVMDTAEEAADYDAMDHAEVNRRFVDDLLAAWNRLGQRPGEAGAQRVLDVGTGTALIPIELCRRVEGVRLVAIDLAEEMLKRGRTHVAREGLSGRIELRRIDAKQTGEAAGSFDAVISNSIVHHIPEPVGVLAEMVRLLRPGGVLFVRDLLRPESDAEVERFVEQYAGGESLQQQQLFRQSLHAALAVEEVAALLTPLGLPREAVQQTSDRHWTIAAQAPPAE